MMKPISLVLALLLSSSFAPLAATAFSLFPFPFPLPLPFSLPSIFGGIIGNSDNSELARMCFPDLGDGEACVAEIFGSFFNRQITIGPECCKAIVEIDEDCTQAIFKPLSNSFFSSSVKQYCTYINN
ncbi:unnamed protein product [Arabidopsis lyrata]|uniref:Prolamin-like domain-containing protein n=1 Tax=Arabidopsis lyrata subsp. lyrata TaxID=81972 RepID=D7L0F1_ARALL|nr:uncharacterized protein LOC9320434 [Arabidopsis lyrata subsp. lyrata]EFH60627.1 hypothetical protein ARALYDRAFT_477575 [Arabidopsis lyrata subsp. lyrata]CAH8259138.1 unnamed protein product [Arabidopsis lyrata]|eukprot:XP_020888922.1 uncharacterized protein LOC9320434 [Arabidopsis lyrata subsp. lyrata]